MESNIGDPELINRLNTLSEQLSNGLRLMGKFGREYAKAEREYKKELAKNTAILRSKDMPVTLIQLQIYGIDNVADKRYERDMAKVLYNTSQENINVLKLQMRLMENQIDREYRG